MSDPLSMFATEEEEDLEKIIDELNDDDDGTEQAVGDSAAVESNNPMSETNSPSLDTIQKPAVAAAAADDDDDDDEFLDNSRSGTTTQSTEVSLTLTYLLKIVSSEILTFSFPPKPQISYQALYFFFT